MIAEYPPLAIFTKLAMLAISESRLEADRPLPTKPRRCKSQEKRTIGIALKNGVDPKPTPGATLSGSAHALTRSLLVLAPNGSVG